MIASQEDPQTTSMPEPMDHRYLENILDDNLGSFGAEVGVEAEVVAEVEVEDVAEFLSLELFAPGEEEEEEENFFEPGIPADAMGDDE